MSNPGISLTAPDDYVSQLAAAQRQQQLAAALTQMGNEPIQAQSAGGITAPISGLSVLAKALNSFGGTYEAGQAAQSQAAARVSDLANATKTIQDLYTLPGQSAQGVNMPVMAPQAAPDLSQYVQTPQLPGGPPQQAPAPTPAPQAAPMPDGHTFDPTQGAISNATGPTPTTPQQQMQTLAGLAGGGPTSQAIYAAAMPETMKTLALQQQMQAQGPSFMQALQNVPEPLRPGALALFHADPAKGWALIGSTTANQADKMAGALVPIAPADYGKYGIDPRNIPPGDQLAFDPIKKIVVEQKIGDTKSQAAQAQTIQEAAAKRDIIVNNPTNSYKVATDQTALLDQAIAQGRLDPNKLSSRTAAMYGQILAADPTADFITPAGIARMKENPQFQQKVMAAATIPTMLQNFENATNKLNYSNLTAVGGVQKWLKGQTNDVDLAQYGPIRNDMLFKIAGVMRGAGMSDAATQLENEVANPTMSPKAVIGYIKGQEESLAPMLHMMAPVTLRTSAFAPGDNPAIGGTAKPSQAPRKVIKYGDLP